MIRLKCEACGSTDLKRRGNMYECAFCGSKYIMDQDEKTERAELTEAKLIQKLEYSSKLHEADKFTEELAVLCECYEMDENNVRVLVKMGRCLRMLNEEEKAIDFYGRALELDPNEGTAYANMGSICLTKHEYQKAGEYYQKGLPLIDKSEFDYWIAYANYAVVVAKEGNPKKAERMIREAEAKGYQNGNTLRKMAGMKIPVWKKIKKLFFY